ncbi:MAG: recombination protein RecR [Bacteroidetes bacterium 4484_249]|nr:MAG: recombination protein RecR [Bacteroidetes bacterium 4484_249]
MNSYSSKLVETAVNEFSRLPGIGRKTALRLALHLLKKDLPVSEALGNSIIKMRNEIMFCKVCYNISDSEICEICANPKRNSETVCVVEDIRDVMAIENTGQYTGVYHILGGIISPMDGIGPNDLNINTLTERISKGEIKEVIMALSTTIEGDTTNFYIYKKIKDFNIKVTTIARGIAIGDELEYADEVTLGRSIVNRMPYESTI